MSTLTGAVFQEAVQFYTGEGFRELNDAARNGRRHYLLPVLEEALMMLPRHEGVTWRGTSRSSFEACLKGSVFQDEGFMSTSVAKDEALKFRRKDGVLLEVHGKSGVPIQDYSEYPEEEEILFPRGTMFSVEHLGSVEGYETIRLVEIDTSWLCLHDELRVLKNDIEGGFLCPLNIPFEVKGSGHLVVHEPTSEAQSYGWKEAIQLPYTPHYDDGIQVGIKVVSVDEDNGFSPAEDIPLWKFDPSFQDEDEDYEDVDIDYLDDDE